LDRERADAHRLVVEAWDGGSPRRRGRLRVSVRVLDENDNAPAFSRGEYRVRLREDAPLGTAVCRLRATDPDLGANGEVRYAINRRQSDPDGYFAVEERSGVLRLRRPLDREARALHRLVVEARDGGTQPEGGLSAQAFVRIEIEDINDNQPIFEQDVYVTNISSHTQPGTEIINVVAIDRDSGIFGIVTYICSGDPHGKFSIDPQFGIIRTKKQLDHESQSVVVLTVQSQLGNSPIYSSTQVNISVTDINDNPPVFHTKSDKVTISHTQPSGTAVYIAHAEDKDSHLNGAIKYSIASKQSDAFSIDPTLGVVNLTRTVFAEKQKEYTLHIAAEDCGSPPLTSLLMLTVVIEEQKMDRTLVFQSLVYQVEISEATSLGAQILQVQAQSLNSQSIASNLMYSLEPSTDSVAFGISSDTGWIYLRKHLNYECAQMLSFRALVSTSEDKNLRQNASTSIIVNVLDENDHSPMFMRKTYFFEIEENLIPSGVIGTITAVDKDSGRNGQLSYFLLSDGKYFKMNSNTGEIINWAALDREERAQHTLRVLVTDAGRPRRSATAAVRISVRDRNDHAPRFPQGALRRQVGRGTS
ncbi:PCD23 protein, partial [Cercotrichas coryphoeus]|nr:PCD23 protein [Cercotrichas coryphoeus]